MYTYVKTECLSLIWDHFPYWSFFGEDRRKSELSCLYYLDLFRHKKTCGIHFNSICLCAKAYCYYFSLRSGSASTEAFLSSILISCHLQNLSSYHLSLETCWPPVPPGALGALGTAPIPGDPFRCLIWEHPFVMHRFWVRPQTFPSFGVSTFFGEP